VSAAASNDVWAVGYAQSTGGYRSFAIHWNGTAWTRFRTPSPGTREHFLHGVTPVSPTDAGAVGSYWPDSGTISRKTLVLHWDGAAWSRVPSQNGGLDENGLSDVDTISPTEMLAVGSFVWDGTSRVLALDGPAWTRAFPPTAALGSPQAIDASSPSDIWLVGNEGDGGLLLHGGGTSWSRTEQPPNLEDLQLYGVADISPTDAWAVGSIEPGNRTQTATLHWDGAAWDTVPSPDPGGESSHLWDAAATGATDVWAVGDYAGLNPDGTSYGPRTLILHWDGTSWTPM
jgi:hypothetical protein